MNRTFSQPQSSCNLRSRFKQRKQYKETPKRLGKKEEVLFHKLRMKSICTKSILLEEQKPWLLDKVRKQGLKFVTQISIEQCFVPSYICSRIKNWKSCQILALKLFTSKIF